MLDLQLEHTAGNLFEGQNLCAINHNLRDSIGDLKACFQRLPLQCILAHFHYEFAQFTRLSMQSDVPVPYIALCFMRRGSMRSRMHQWRDEEAFFTHRFCLSFTSEIGGYSEYAAHQLTSGTSLYIPLNVFQRAIENDELANTSQLFVNLKSEHPRMTLLTGKVTSCLHTLIAEVENEGAESEDILMAIIDEVIDILLDNHCRTRNRMALSTKDILAIQSARLLVDKSLYSPLRLSSIAAQVGTNEYKLKKGFKQLYQTPLYHYVCRRRLEVAAELLKATNKSITEIANVVGIHNHGHFSVAFKKHFRFTPSAYRTFAGIKNPYLSS